MTYLGYNNPIYYFLGGFKMNIILFTQKTSEGIKVTDDLNRCYGSYNNISEAHNKIKELYNFFENQ